MANYMDENERDEEQGKKRAYKSALRIYKKAVHPEEEADPSMPPEPVNGSAAVSKKSPYFASDEEAERLREPGIKEDSFFPPPGATLRDPYKADPRYAAITEGMPGLESVEYGMGSINKVGAAEKMTALAAEKAEQRALSKAAVQEAKFPAVTDSSGIKLGDVEALRKTSKEQGHLGEYWKQKPKDKLAPSSIDYAQIKALGRTEREAALSSLGENRNVGLPGEDYDIFENQMKTMALQKTNKPGSKGTIRKANK